MVLRMNVKNFALALVFVKGYPPGKNFLDEFLINRFDNGLSAIYIDLVNM
ncbi:hypothetical protein ES703_69764 [subsurface metagenome]